MQDAEQHHSRFPAGILLNIALGLTAAGGIAWGGPAAALGALGLTLDEMILARSDITAKPPEAVAFERDYKRGVEYGLPALALGLVAAFALKIRLGPEPEFMGEVRSMEAVPADPKREKELEHAILGYLREHEDEVVNQMRRSGIALVPSLEVEGWAEPTEPLQLRVDGRKTLVAEWLPKPERPAGIRTPGQR